MRETPDEPRPKHFSNGRKGVQEKKGWVAVIVYRRGPKGREKKKEVMKAEPAPFHYRLRQGEGNAPARQKSRKRKTLFAKIARRKRTSGRVWKKKQRGPEGRSKGLKENLLQGGRNAEKKKNEIANLSQTTHGKEESNKKEQEGGVKCPRPCRLEKGRIKTIPPVTNGTGDPKRRKGGSPRSRHSRRASLPRGERTKSQRGGEDAACRQARGKG